jgi:ClpP class serine protease
MNRGGNMDAVSGISSYESIAAMLKSADADPAVNGILLEMDTPGGEVAGLAALYQTMGALQKPIWSIANSVAASAGYGIAAATARTAVVPSGTSGSIGTVIVMRDVSAALDRAGVKHAVIRSGSKKMQGSGIEGISPDLITAMQALVDEESQKFFQHVSNARGVSIESIAALEGASLTPEAAQAAGLIDAISTVSDFHQAMVAAIATGKAVAKQPAKPTAKPVATAPSQPPRNSLSGKPTMTDFTQAQLDAAVATATASASATGASAERDRISAILNSDEAKGRSKLAAHLALKTATTVEDAKSMLAAADVVDAANTNPLGASKNLLAAAMATVDNPTVGADDGRKDGADSAKQKTPAEIEAAQVAQVKAQFAPPKVQ